MAIAPIAVPPIAVMPVVTAVMVTPVTMMMMMVPVADAHINSGCLCRSGGYGRGASDHGCGQHKTR